MNQVFCSEEDTRCIDLRERLDAFYESTSEYTAFHQPNSKLEYWQPIKGAVQECLVHQQQCCILEFGAGCTGFGDYLQDIRSQVAFDVQDVTAVNKEYLSTQADNVHIGDVRKVHNKYDIIFSTFVWEHITTPRAVINHLLNLLNPGGSIFIASPRYDFPFYLSPSAKHLSVFERVKISTWLTHRRLQVMLGGSPDFLLHLDPSLFHGSWFRDADAIHWVSFWDLNSHLPKNLEIHRLHIPIKGLKGRIWEKFFLLFVQIKKPIG